MKTPQTDGTPPATSWWIGKTRDELSAEVARQRYRMSLPNVPNHRTGAFWEPGPDAERALRQRFAIARAEKAVR